MLPGGKHMLSAKLIHLIESHWDQITARVLRRIREDPEMTNIGSLSDAELREWGEDLLSHLGRWFAGGAEPELMRRYEQLGRVRFHEGIPLYEALRGLMFTKRLTMDFVHEQGLASTTMDALAEEEMERHVDSFFDTLVCRMARGYEDALREAVAPAPRTVRSRGA